MTRDHPRAASGWLDRFDATHAQRDALSFAGVSHTHAKVVEAATRAGEAFSGSGVEGGDLVAVIAPPSVAGVCLVHAMLDREIVMLPLNARSTEHEQVEALRATGAQELLVAGVSGAEIDASSRNDARDRDIRLAEAAGCGLLEFDVAAVWAGGAGRGMLRRARDSARGQARVDRRAELRTLQAALVLRTSGTSGRAKTAVLGLDNLMASARGSRELLGTGPRNRWLSCMPLFHIGGLSILIRSVLDGSCVVLHEAFDAEAVARALDQDGITHVSFVATMLQRVLEVRAGAPAPEALEVVLLGGGPVSRGLLREAASLGYPLAPTYGLTEAASQVATRPPSARWPADADPAGGLVPLPGVALRIVDDSGAVMSAGEEGSIEVKGPVVMHGYLDDPEATRRSIRDGWLATGDVGRLDAAGRLRVLDRRSDLIVSGGENIYPAEIESVLVEFEGIVEAAVIGRPDAEFGARPIAFYVPARAGGVDPLALRRHCESRLARYKQPVEFRESAGLPRTASGKLLRRELVDPR